MKKIMFLFLATSLFFGCSSDDDSPPGTVNPPTAASFTSLLDQAKANRTITQQFNLTSGGELVYTSPNGVVLTIQQACLKLNGTPVTGNVTLKYIEIFEAEDMAVTGISTMGYNENDQLAILKTGGAFNIQVFKDNTLLTLDCNYNLQVPYNLTGGYDSQMVLWTGELAANQQVVWTQNPDVGGIERGNSVYYAFLDTFGWVNLDRLHHDPRPKTHVSAKVPQIYHGTNSQVYFTFDDLEFGLGTFNTFEGASNSFKETYGNIPIGITMHVIFVTEHNGSFKYAIKSATIAANHAFEFLESDLRVGTANDVEDAIDDLF